FAVASPTRLNAAALRYLPFTGVGIGEWTHVYFARSRRVRRIRHEASVRGKVSFGFSELRLQIRFWHRRRSGAARAVERQIPEVRSGFRAKDAEQQESPVPRPVP